MFAPKLFFVIGTVAERIILEETCIDIILPRYTNDGKDQALMKRKILNLDRLLEYEALDPLPKPGELRTSAASLSRKLGAKENKCTQKSRTGLS